jgi:hypothetical protein
VDHHSILERMTASPAVEGKTAAPSASQSPASSVSAGIAAGGVHPLMSPEPEPRFPAEDGGQSLAAMAQSDLDAALQLLVERAQYITGASGAAIALRRGQHNDMLCRASTGSNAPQLGALLSMEYGLSGECVRTRLPLRCDDAERDARVNHEICRQLGIASVVVMPILSEEQVLGVFELFSGKPRAFEERDISALLRLSEMVETAVMQAAAMPNTPAIPDPGHAEPQLPVEVIVEEARPAETPISLAGAGVLPASPVKEVPLPEPEKREPDKVELEVAKPAPAASAPKKPLFWSAAMQTPGVAGRAEEDAASIAVPPVLRNLQKCQACGFPVSQGRAFCVECEERQWRGQRLTRPIAGASAQTSATKLAGREQAVPAPVAAARSTSQPLTKHASQDLSGSGNSALFSGSAAPSGSWFAANKYVLGALLVVAIVIAAIVWLR